jgi:Trk-type K+ transport system membrane component
MNFKAYKKITAEDRDFALASFEKMSAMITSGEWNYPQPQLQNECISYQIVTWVAIHPILTGCALTPLTLIGFMGYVSIVLFSFGLMYYQKGFQNYQILIEQYKSGTLGKVNSATPHAVHEKSLPEELKKLKELHDSGVLSDAEFSSAKDSVIKKNAA